MDTNFLIDDANPKDSNDIDFENLHINKQYIKKPIEKIDTKNNDFMLSLKDEYVESLKNKYHDADEDLFEHIDELLEESEDTDKLMQILDSL
jgi:hypothetical protein